MVFKEIFRTAQFLPTLSCDQCFTR